MTSLLPNVKISILMTIVCLTVMYCTLVVFNTNSTFVHNDGAKMKYLVRNVTPTLNEPLQSVYFIDIKRQEDTSLQPRTACAIESASKHNPKSDINVLIVPWHDYVKNISTIYTFGENVKIMNRNAKEILKNTPLEKWYSEGSFRDGQFGVTHLSDALRIATLWKYGGIYLDTDMWSVKSLTELRNTIGAENLNTLNGAAMMFDQFHPFLFSVMIEFVKKYNKNLFTVVGPRLLTDVMMKMCNVTGKIDSIAWESYKLCSNVSVLPPNAFYPIDYGVRDKFFSNATVDWVVWWNSYTFHLWNQVTGKTKIKLNSRSLSKTLLEQIAETNCPQVYKIMKRNGTM